MLDVALHFWPAEPVNLRLHAVVVKIWPHPRWRHVSLTFQLSEELQSSPSKSMQFPTFSRSSPLRRLQLRAEHPYQQFTMDLHRRLRHHIFLHVHNVGRHSTWAIMDNEGLPYMHSQQVSTTDHDRYNKSTRANHAITKISPAPTAHSSISKACTRMKGGTKFDSIQKLLTNTHFPDFYNSFNLRIIVKLLLLPVVFPS